MLLDALTILSRRTAADWLGLACLIAILVGALNFGG